MGFGIDDMLSMMKNDPRIGDKDQDIKFNKLFNELSHKANEMGLLSKCRICGQDIVGRANSHSVPQHILKNIDTDGHYCQTTCAIANGLMFGPIGRVNRTGLNNTGTFHLLCKECENKIFKDYEDPYLLDEISKGKKELLTDKILAELMLKSALRERYKKEFSRNISQLMNNIAEEREVPYRTSTLSDELNVKEYDHYIDVCLDIINTKKSDRFELFYFDVLDHSSSFACQLLIGIQKTVTNIVINDVFNFDPSYNIVLSHFVIFPLKDKTICFAYCLKDELQRIKPYIDYLNTLNQNCQRRMFQATLLLYTEEVYTNEKMIEELSRDDLVVSFIKSSVDHGMTTESLLEMNMLFDRPMLVAPNHFRKMKIYI